MVDRTWVPPPKTPKRQVAGTENPNADNENCSNCKRTSTPAQRRRTLNLGVTAGRPCANPPNDKLNTSRQPNRSQTAGSTNSPTGQKPSDRLPQPIARRHKQTPEGLVPSPALHRAHPAVCQGGSTSWKMRHISSNFHLNTQATGQIHAGFPQSLR